MKQRRQVRASQRVGGTRLILVSALVKWIYSSHTNHEVKGQKVKPPDTGPTVAVCSVIVVLLLYNRRPATSTQMWLDKICGDVTFVSVFHLHHVTHV